MPCQSTATNHSSGPSLRPCETHQATVTGMLEGPASNLGAIVTYIEHSPSEELFAIMSQIIQEFGDTFVSARATSYFGMLQFSRPTNFLGGEISHEQFIRFNQKPAMNS